MTSQSQLPWSSNSFFSASTWPRNSATVLDNFMCSNVMALSVACNFAIAALVFSLHLVAALRFRRRCAPWRGWVVWKMVDPGLGLWASFAKLIPKEEASSSAVCSMLRLSFGDHIECSGEVFGVSIVIVDVFLLFSLVPLTEDLLFLPFAVFVPDARAAAATGLEWVSS